ncbi:MAG TPA: metallophosphoesterase [Pyrinomonadaceae bacterium]|nr:metallophosphoesterase [Pyrinomonadaceae bacterium]
MPIFKSRKKRIVILTALGLVLIFLFTAVWAFFIEPNRLVIKKETIELMGWPTEFENMRVAVLSDLHVGSPYIDADKLQLIVSKVNEAEPDMVVLLGDYMSSMRLGGKVIEPEIIAENLKGLRARHGVFSVLGNHDWWYDGPRVKQALEAVGIRDLEDDVTRIERNGQAIWLAGLKDSWTNQPDVEGTLAKITDESPVIALTHNPDLFVKIPPRVILTLAGHTHGGQVNLPLVGRTRVPSEYGQRYAAGHIVENNHHLFVTTGIGTSIIPVRFRVPPEIVILNLKASAPGGAAR